MWSKLKINCCETSNIKLYNIKVLGVWVQVLLYWVGVRGSDTVDNEPIRPNQIRFLISDEQINERNIYVSKKTKITLK